MKKVSLIAFSIILFWTQCDSQSIFCYESKVIDFKVPRNANSYEGRFLKITSLDTIIIKDIHHLSRSWNPINENEIVGCNTDFVGKFKFSLNKNAITTINNVDTIYKPRKSDDTSIILEISANESSVYIKIAPYNGDMLDDYQLLKVNLKNKILDTIKIKKPINVSNLFTSKNDRYISFINHQNIESNSLRIDYLMIYDLIESRLITVDSSFRRKKESFGSLDDQSIMLWQNDHQLLYYKHDNDKRFGSIYKFDIIKSSKEKVLDYPFDANNNFSYYDSNFYSEIHNQILKYDSKGILMTVYKVGYIFDFLYNAIYVIGKN